MNELNARQWVVRGPDPEGPELRSRKPRNCRIEKRCRYRDLEKSAEPRAAPRAQGRGPTPGPCSTARSKAVVTLLIGT